MVCMVWPLTCLWSLVFGLWSLATGHCVWSCAVLVLVFWSEDWRLVRELAFDPCVLVFDFAWSLCLWLGT